MATAPIALFVYRRPGCVRAVLESLLQNEQAKASDIFIFSDAPKTPELEKDVADVRDVIRAVRGFRDVTLVERAENYGLARSIIDGVTTLCNSHGRVIVVEDDLIVAPDFLIFMNWGLDHYSSEQRVMQVAGHLFPVAFDTPDDALFLPLATSWGWATWQRAWQHFDPDARGYDILRMDRALRRRFDLDGSYPYFRMLQMQLRGEVDSWAIRWYLNIFLRDGLVLYPKSNLVVHDGWGESATHVKLNTGFSASAVGPEQMLLRPPLPAIHQESLRAHIAYFRNATKPDWWRTFSAICLNATKAIRTFQATGRGAS
jgi:hypothetical protein